MLRDDRQAGQSAAALIGVHFALVAGYDRVLLVPGDTPLLDASEVDELLETCATDRWPPRSCPTATAQGRTRSC